MVTTRGVTHKNSDPAAINRRKLMTHRRSRAAVAGAAAFMLTLASACGADGGSDSSPGVTDTTIKIGLFAPLSGDSAVYGKGLHTVESMYDELNAKGGINGRKIEMVIEDSKCDPTTARLAVTKLIEKDKVFMIWGGMCSAAVQAALPLIQRSGIPYIVGSAATPAIVDPPSKNVFHGWVNSASGTAMNADLLGSFIESTGKTKVGVISQSDEWGQGWLDSFEKSLEESKAADEAEIVVSEEIAPDTTDATAQVQKLKNAGVDIAIVYAYPDPMSVFLRNADQQGLAVPVITGQGTFPEDQVDRIGSTRPVENFYASYCMEAPLDSPELAPYRDALAKHYPKDSFDLSSMLGPSGYDVNVAVLEKMGDDLTWDNWIKTAEGITDLETAAAPLPISYAPFDADDPSTRLGVDSCNVSHLDPSSTDDDPKIVVSPPDWEEASK